MMAEYDQNKLDEEHIEDCESRIMLKLHEDM